MIIVRTCLAWMLGIFFSLYLLTIALSSIVHADLNHDPNERASEYIHAASAVGILKFCEARGLYQSRLTQLGFETLSELFGPHAENPAMPLHQLAITTWNVLLMGFYNGQYLHPADKETPQVFAAEDIIDEAGCRLAEADFDQVMKGLGHALGKEL